MDLIRRRLTPVAAVVVLVLAAYGGVTLVSDLGAPALAAPMASQSTMSDMMGGSMTAMMGEQDQPGPPGADAQTAPGDEMTQLCAAHMAQMTQATTPQQMIQLCTAQMNDPAMQRLMGPMMSGMMGR